MSLIDDIEAIRSKVQSLKAASKGIEESRDLQQRLKELQQVSTPLENWTTQVTLFRTQAIEVPLSLHVVDQARKRVENVQKKFCGSREARSLTQGQDWSYLKRYVKEAKQGIKESLAIAWQKFIEGMFTGESPPDLKRALAPTDTNKKELVNYEQEWRALRDLAKYLPESDKEFSTAKEIAERLREIHGRFERDVPDEVKIFLESVGREGAGLALLTEGVRQWLEKNQSIEHYRIVAK